VHHEVGVGGKEKHLTFCVATIGAVGVSLDKLSDSETVRGFTRRVRSVFVHALVAFR
jgi:hypothetical protein